MCLVPMGNPRIRFPVREIVFWGTLQGVSLEEFNLAEQDSPIVF